MIVQGRNHTYRLVGVGCRTFRRFGVGLQRRITTRLVVAAVAVNRTVILVRVAVGRRTFRRFGRCLLLRTMSQFVVVELQTTNLAVGAGLPRRVNLCFGQVDYRTMSRFGPVDRITTLFVGFVEGLRTVTLVEVGQVGYRKGRQFVAVDLRITSLLVAVVADRKAIHPVVVAVDRILGSLFVHRTTILVVVVDLQKATLLERVVAELRRVTRLVVASEGHRTTILLVFAVRTVKGCWLWFVRHRTTSSMWLGLQFVRTKCWLVGLVACSTTRRCFVAAVRTLRLVVRFEREVHLSTGSDT